MGSKAVLLSAFVALALAAPASASAKGRHASPVVFPMKAADYRKLMDGRIDRVLAAIDKKLDRSGVSSDRKKAIHKTFDEASKEARVAIEHAAADGTVTEAEATKVKPLVAGIRGKVRERLKAEKSGKPSAKPVDAKAKSKGEEAAKGCKPSKGEEAAKGGKPSKGKGEKGSPAKAKAAAAP